MKYSVLTLLIGPLLGCSQSPSVLQPQKLQTTVATVDFGTAPLWREADTAVWISIAGHNAITSIVIGDSNFTLLDTSRVNDSLRISLRFQPQSVANHSGECLLLSKQDTLARLTLVGQTSPFERMVGDSYVFFDDSGKFDSIWVSALPLTISTRESNDIDLLFRSAVLKQNSDWIVQPQSIPLPVAEDTHVTLPVKTLTASDVNWGGVFDTDYRFPTQGSSQNYASHSSADLIATIDSVDRHWIGTNQITMDHSLYLKMRFTDVHFTGAFHGNYSAAIGFFVSCFRSSSEQGYYMGQNISKQSGNSYHLLRFHLRR